MRSAILVLVLLAVGCSAGCSAGEHRTARAQYNEGLTALATPDYEAAEKLLLEAISDAGVDPTLRFSAQYNLASAYAAHAEKLRTAEPPELDQALSMLGQADGWLRQALKLRPDDEDAKANLTLVTSKRSAILDQMSEGGRALEKRLDTLIESHREVRDQIQKLEEALAAAVASGDVAPMGAELAAMADRERVLLSDAGVIGDMAADEIDGIGAKQESERTDEEKVRLVQLKNLDVYLQDARSRLSETRRKLQDRIADGALDRAEAALGALKRAREQLLDPVTVLQGIAADQLAVLQQSAFLGLARGEGSSMSMNVPAGPPPVAPPWLTVPSLVVRQGALRDRVEEVRSRLQAALNGAAEPAPSADPAAAQAAQQRAKMMALVAKAEPSVAEASSKMSLAHDQLVAEKLSPAQESERAALLALSLAIEQFAELRQTIDLAVAEQDRMISLLSPTEKAAAEMSPAERSSNVDRGIAQNLERLDRLVGLLADELAKQQAEAAQAQSQAGGAANPEAEQALTERFAQAELLRARAATETLAFKAALAANREGTRGADPVATARTASATLHELQVMFFSVVEHLQALIRDQNETRDQTVRAQGEDDLGRSPLLPGLVERQAGHQTMAGAIAEVLAQQADSAGQAPAAAPPGQGPSAEDLGKAAEEVRLAGTDMTGASDVLREAADPAAVVSVDMQPSVDSQASALEHLVAALRLLQPPPPPQEQKDQDKQEQKDQDQPQEPKPAEPNQDPSGALQRVREAEAQRQKERRERQQSQPTPVDKDW